MPNKYELLNIDRYQESPEIAIDTRMNNEDRRRFPKYGWLFPCLICCIPTNNDTKFIVSRSRPLEFNKQTLKTNTGYIAAMCASCTKKLKNGIIKNLCYYEPEN